MCTERLPFAEQIQFHFQSNTFLKQSTWPLLQDNVVKTSDMFFWWDLSTLSRDLEVCKERVLMARRGSTNFFAYVKKLAMRSHFCGENLMMHSFGICAEYCLERTLFLSDCNSKDIIHSMHLQWDRCFSSRSQETIHNNSSFYVAHLIIFFGMMTLTPLISMLPKLILSVPSAVSFP